MTTATDLNNKFTTVANLLHDESENMLRLGHELGKSNNAADRAKGDRLIWDSADVARTARTVERLQTPVVTNVTNGLDPMAALNAAIVAELVRYPTDGAIIARAAEAMTAVVRGHAVR